MKNSLRTVVMVVLAVCMALPLLAQEKVDSTMIAKIKDEGMNHSQVMDILSYIADVYGPRLTWSPAHKRAANWAKQKLSEMGMSNAHLESWGPAERGWALKKYWANVVGEQVWPLISYPKAWSPGTGGTVTADVVYLDAWTDSALDTYKGKLKGKIVLLDTVRAVKAHFTPEGTRDADSTLLELADAGMPNQNRRGGGGGNPFRNNPAARTRALLTYRKWQLCQDEGAVAVLNVSPRGDGGNVFVQQATVPMHPDTPFTKRINAYDPKAPEILPQIMVAAEHYDRLIRMMQRGEHPKITMDLDVKWYDPDSSYDVIAEYPGTDPTLKDEVVMIGAHFDSWHGGTGATDNGTGSAVCMEAMRILKTIGAQPKRTIRIGLWSGEEEGLLGSAAYVKAHLGERDGTFMNDPTSVKQLPEADKFDVYFNNDNGSGKVRGVYMQGNDQVRNIFHAWLEPFRDMGAYTLSLNNTGGTDHLSFDAVGLPGFQFIQDPLEYDTRTHHSTMDLWERAQEGDLEQAATIMAAFAYDAAVRDQKFPRKELPGSKTTQGGSSQGTGTGKN